MAQAILACGILVGALVVRTVLAERKQPGSARRQWKFLANRAAVIAGILGFIAVVLVVTLTGQPLSYLAWGLLAGLLVAFIVDQVTDGYR